MSTWIAAAALLLAVLTLAWQILRDMRKDRADELHTAERRARDAARLEDRIRRLEGRPNSDDDD